MNTSGEAIAFIFMMVLATCGYLLPAIIAKCRNHYNRGAIFVLTLLGGWTLIGWVIAMVWAMMRSPRRRSTPTGKVHPEPPETAPPRPGAPPNDETKVDMANTIADLLRIQLAILPQEYKAIEDNQGHIYRKSIGYVYGYIDSFLTTIGYDMSDMDIGVPITFHVLRKLFPNGRAERYIEFLMHNMNDPKVVIGTMHGGQQWLDYGKPGSKGAPMGLFSFILEERALDTAPDVCSEADRSPAERDGGVGDELDRENDPDTAPDADASFSPDVDAFLNDPAIAALRQQERALSLDLAGQVADDPEAFRRAVGATGKVEAREFPQGDKRDRARWDMFTGIPNTHDVLMQKSDILCKLILMGIEDGKFVASIIIDKCALTLTFSQRNLLISNAESAVFLLYIVAQFVIKSVSTREQAVLMPAVAARIKEQLGILGYDSGDFTKLLLQRHNEYGNYKRWSIEVTQGGRPLFWDFATRVSDSLGVGENYLFNLLLTTMLLRKIDDWNLPRLLRG
jgi:hypothetical protein